MVLIAYALMSFFEDIVQWDKAPCFVFESSESSGKIHVDTEAHLCHHWSPMR